MDFGDPYEFGSDDDSIVADGAGAESVVPVQAIEYELPPMPEPDMSVPIHGQQPHEIYETIGVLQCQLADETRVAYVRQILADDPAIAAGILQVLHEMGLARGPKLNSSGAEDDDDAEDEDDLGAALDSVNPEDKYITYPLPLADPPILPPNATSWIGPQRRTL